MLAVFTKLQNAQKVKLFLIKRNLIDENYLPLKVLDHIYFPIIKKINVPRAKVINSKLTFEIRPSKITIETLLQKKLTNKQLQLLPKSQELVGSIMILEVPKELEKKEKIIAEAYLKLNKHVATVVKKTKIHSGVYRTRKVKILAGKKSKETIHHENGIKVKLHLEKTYFSARSGSERLRIAKQVKKEENVLVMFSGAGPFPLVIAKHSNAKVTGIEINPLAHQYAIQNMALNKLPLYMLEGNVRVVLPTIKKKFDRIVMPLPKTGEEFLKIALKKAKPNARLHLYSFLSEKDVNKEARRIAKEYSVKVLRKVKCGQFSPSISRICFDIRKNS